MARAQIAGMTQEWEAALPAGEVELRIETAVLSRGIGGDRVRLVAASGSTEVLLAELDGRYWTAETAASFTGRVTGVYAVRGTVSFADFRYQGTDRPA